MTNTITYRAMDASDFAQIIALGNDVHGDGYLDNDNIQEWFAKGISQGINANFVAYDNDKLVGFRLSFAPGSFTIDQWYSPELWQCDISKVAYFKCNTVDDAYRGKGIGSTLLKLSTNALQQQGASAGVSHLWRQSPGNSAVMYFTKCGGVLIKDHPDKWNADSKAGYECTFCGFDCHCVAAEMIIYFNQN
ncbi:N-acetyltransferase family protein [Thalassotalea maritima]|uniref:GNAT family N-acetyltransferase n=1 Tax=Thalassotalea maritima TaxID=3242416 RepID=UPI003527F646